MAARRSGVRSLVRRSALRRVFYGWWMTLAAAVLLGYGGGVYFYGFSAFFNPILRDFGWTRAQTSLAFSLARMENGLVAPIVGFLVDRVGPRKLLFVGIPAFALGYFWLATVHSLWEFYAAFILTTIGQSLAMSGVLLVAVGNWFVRHRAKAMAVATAGSALGGPIVFALAWVIEGYGWRAASVLAGLGFLAVGLPLALLIRHRPEPYGLFPDGAGQAPTLHASSSEPEPSFSARAALRTPAFWLLAVAFALRQIGNSALTVHSIPHMIAVGFPPQLAASVLGALTLVSVPGRLGFGWLADRYDKRYLVAIVFAVEMVGMLVFTGFTEPAHALLFLLLYSPAYGAAFTLQPAIRGDYFGRRSFGTIQGLMYAVQIIGSMIGPVAAGHFFDLYETYTGVFVGMALLNLVAIPLVLLARRPQAAR